MSHLYYENLPDVNSEKQAEAIMRGVYDNLTPYFGFMDNIYYKALKNRIEIEAEPLKLEDMLKSEIQLIKSNENYPNLREDSLLDLVELEEFREIFDRQLRWIVKLVSKGKGVLYRLIENTDDEKIDKIKSDFLSANEIFLTRNVESSHRAKVITSYPPYDIIVLDSNARIKGKKRTKFYLRSNLYQLQMIRESLKILQDRPMDYNRNLIRLLENIEYVFFEDLEHLSIGENDWIFLTEKNRPGNDIQREFTKISLTTPDFAILEGPPGSGKTTTICEIIYQAIKKQMRVLLVASTHVAVDNVLEKLMDPKFKYHDIIKQTILPIRIGRTDRLSDLAAEYHEDNFWNEEKKKLIKWFRQIKQRSESQNMMLELLESKESTEYEPVRNAFIRAANLVCGTTIGILHHPEIQRVKRGEVIHTPYDLLILDEASKTTFQEFMVPSLVAERFIIVGDIRQLPPYVEEDGVISNIESGDQFETRWVTLINNILQADKQNAFGSKTSGKYCIILKNPLKLEELPILSNIIPKELHWYYLTTEDKANCNELLGSSIIIGTRQAFQKHQKYLPVDIRWSNEEVNRKIRPINMDFFKEFDTWNRRITATQQRRLKTKKGFLNDASWEEAIGWRLIRDYELRMSKNEKDRRYWDAIEELIPRSWDEETRKENFRLLHGLKRLAFPSIIELLQKGFERSKYQEKRGFGSCLTDGIPEGILATRHRILRYQHRMHPDISQFPREVFYDKEALQDLPGIAQSRQLNYPFYKHSSLWIDVRDQSSPNLKVRYDNSNEAEAETIITELQDLMKWTKTHPKPVTGYWEIAVLPFYKGQERLIRIKLQKLFKTTRKRAFKDFKANIQIELCVVDRFQGHEADIVFLSFVRNKNTGVGFLDTPNRLNVALTRAKYQRLLVGDREFFLDQNRSAILQQLATQTKPKKLYR